MCMYLYLYLYCLLYFVPEILRSGTRRYKLCKNFPWIRRLSYGSSFLPIETQNCLRSRNNCPKIFTDKFHHVMILTSCSVEKNISMIQFFMLTQKCIILPKNWRRNLYFCTSNTSFSSKIMCLYFCSLKIRKTENTCVLYLIKNSTLHKHIEPKSISWSKGLIATDQVSAK